MGYHYTMLLCFSEPHIWLKFMGMETFSFHMDHWIILYNDQVPRNRRKDGSGLIPAASTQFQPWVSIHYEDAVLSV